MGHGINVGELAWPHLELGRTTPISTFDHVTRGTCRECIGAGSNAGIYGGNCRYLLDSAVGLIILSALQVSVDEIIHRMQLLVEFLAVFSGLGRCRVGFDRLLPVTDACEDVRWHVQCMRSIRRNLGIAARRVDASLRNRRIIVKVDQVVNHAGMLRLAKIDLLENACALELICIGLVGQRRADIERKRVVDLRLVIVGVSQRESLHGLQVILRTCGN